jgi:hypothetical protein
MGSPYHARLFGMQAALVTEASGREQVTASDVEQGLASALDDWAEMSSASHGLFTRALRDSASGRRMIALAGIVASQMSAISLERLLRVGSDILGEYPGMEADASDALARLEPALTPTPGGELWMFEDTLAPQFLLLMAKQPAPRTVAPTPAEEMRAMLRGVDGL